MKNSDKADNEKPAKGLSREEELVLTISKQYQLPGGGIDWTEAVKEHPEWRDALQYDSHRATGGFQKGSNIANKLRRMGLLERTSKTKTGRITKAMREKFKAGQQARREREREEGGKPVAVAPGGNPTSEVVTQEELNRLVQREVAKVMDRVIEEAACCQKCGKSLAEQLRSELHKLRFNR